MQCIITNITLIMFCDLISHLTWKNKQIKSKESDIRTHMFRPLNFLTNNSKTSNRI